MTKYIILFCLITAPASANERVVRAHSFAVGLGAGLAHMLDSLHKKHSVYSTVVKHKR